MYLNRFPLTSIFHWLFIACEVTEFWDNCLNVKHKPTFLQQHVQICNENSILAFSKSMSKFKVYFQNYTQVKKKPWAASVYYVHFLLN